MSRLTTIISKEWEEVFRNRMVLASVVLTPLVFVGIAIGTLASVTMFDEKSTAALEKESEEIIGLAGSLCEGLSGIECLQAYMGSMMMSLFLVLPVVLPGVFAAYSVVGEKTSRTLEPLLATPVTTVELLAGKAISAVLPAVLSTWVGAAAYLVIAQWRIEPAAAATLLAPHWIVALLVLSPLLALLSVFVAMIVSSRVDDPRAAQQISGMVVIPVILGLMGQSFGLLVINGTLVFGASAVLLLLDAALLWLTVRLFDRETILTRWK